MKVNQFLRYVLHAILGLALILGPSIPVFAAPRGLRSGWIGTASTMPTRI